MKYYHVVVPTKLTLGINRKTKKPNVYRLNLNIYRNTHFFQLNNAKKLFTEIVSSSTEIKEIPKLKKVFLCYIYHPERKKCDTNNVCCVVDKFFQDTLTKLNIIEDDDFEHVVGTIFLKGEVDKDNPRVEVFISGTD